MEDTQNGSFVWKPGDVILDLYEVRPVTEGFGVNTCEKPYHEGGYGRVYKVWHRAWNVYMAVKVPRLVSDTQKDNFSKECDVWINLGEHPHIAQCYYVRTVGGIPHVFAEFIDGGSLEEWINSGRLYAGDCYQVLRRILDVSIQIAWGLEFAHAQGVVHQDIKPANVMVTSGCVVRLVDFGLAQARRGFDSMAVDSFGDATIVAQRDYRYTPAYCSPEQASQTETKFNSKTDMWSWGLCVLQMFCGERFWSSGLAAPHVLLDYGQGEIRKSGIPVMPAAVLHLLQKCFALDPDQRPQSMHAAAECLKDAFSTELGNEYIRPFPRGASVTPSVLNNRALSRLDLGDGDSAERLWVQALTLDPCHLASTYNYGLWKANTLQGKEDGLIASLLAVPGHARGKWKWSVLLAQAYLAIGNSESALEVLNKLNVPATVCPQLPGLLARAKTVPSVGYVRTLDRQGKHLVSRAIAVMPDGCHILSGSDGDVLKLVELSSGHVIRIFKGHTRGICAATVTCDGAVALSSAYDMTIKVWNISDAKCVHTFSGYMCFSLCVSSDGRYALSVGDENPLPGTIGNIQKAMRIWDLDAKKCDCVFGHTGGDIVDAFFLSNKTILSVGSEELKIWDMCTGQCLHRRRLEHEASSAVVSPDETFILVGTRYDTILMIDLKTDACLREFKGHNHTVNAIAVIRDGKMAVSGSYDGTMKLWSLETGECLRTFKRQNGSGHPQSVAITPTGYVLLRTYEEKGPDNDVELWSVQAFMHYPWSPSVEYFIDQVHDVDTMLACEQQFEKLFFLAEVDLNHDNYVSACRHILEIRAINGFKHHPSLRALNARLAGRCARKGLLSFQYVNHLGVDTNFLLSKIELCDKRLFSTVSWDGCIQVWDIKELECVCRYEGRDIDLKGADTTLNCCVTMGWSPDQGIAAWALDPSRCLRTFARQETSYQYSSISQGGEVAAGVCYEPDMRHNYVSIWDVRSGELIQQLSGFESNISAVMVTADARNVICGENNGAIRMWDIASGKCLKAFCGHVQSVRTLRAWPLSERFMSCDSNTIKLWDIKRGICLRTLSLPDYVDEKKKAKCRRISVAVLNDERYMISATDSAFVGIRDEVKVWDLLSGECLHTVPDQHVHSIAVAGDGRYLMLGCADGMHIWELDWEYDDKEATLTTKAREW